MSSSVNNREHVLTISEYGKVVRQYFDTDKDNFKKVALEMCRDHINTLDSGKDIKNSKIHFYTN